ncbi:MAG: type II secretion system F family protein [Candidatus Micrarchaeaceae archaeon]
MEEKKVIGYTKPKGFLFFRSKPRPIYEGGILGSQQTEVKSNLKNVKKPSAFQIYLDKAVLKHKGLEDSLKEVGITSTPREFASRMFFNSLLIAILVSVSIAIAFFKLNPKLVIIAPVIGYGVFSSLFNRFLMFPAQKAKSEGKLVERDILFAARDMVISMRSGMPLFNAIVAVSKGYGYASEEFAKIVRLVELGAPIEQAIEEVSSKSQSPTFKRLMLQASVSIKAGADVISALQGVVEDATQERVIELRRYGQRLNALAMFYMLFGVIFPSMGIAVAAILTTFIALVTITPIDLLFALIGIGFMQFVFVNIMRTSRPVFAM